MQYLREEDLRLEEWGEHPHFCDICGCNWIHVDSPECYAGSPARCPEHEEGE